MKRKTVLPMAKVNQVTNDEERDAMQDRITEAATHLGNPLIDEAEKRRLMPAYNAMVEMMKAYDRAEYCKKYPGVREIYEQLGWIVGTGKVEQPETAAAESLQDPEPLQEPLPATSNYADFLDD